MALTAAGRELTDAHRIAQVQIGAGALLEARATWPLLDLANLDATAPTWSAVQLSMMRRRYAMSQSLAAQYLTDYRIAELGADLGAVVLPGFNEYAAATTLRVAGPIVVKQLISVGMDAEQAYARAARTVAGRVQQWALAGGRNALMSTAAQDVKAAGYRRVSDGHPCTFCAMLVSRGARYRTESGGTFKSHAHCGCGVEIVYGAWEPTETEGAWNDAYAKASRETGAAGEKRNAANILPRMRRSGLFSDSPTP